MIRFMTNLFASFRWSIESARDKLLDIEHIYDVVHEVTGTDRYLVHIWHSAGVGVSYLSERIVNVLSRRPRGVKVDVLLYERGEKHG